MNAAIANGAKVTLIPRFDPDKALEIIGRDRVTVFMGVPTMYNAMLHCESRARRRPLDAAAVRVGRLVAAGRADARVRAGLRLHHPRGLRPLGDLPGRLLQPPRPRAQAGLDRHADRGRGDEAGRRRRQRRAGRRGRRDRDPRPQRDEGLLGAPRRHRGGHQRRRLVPHRRHGEGRRRRLLLHRRPQEGADHPRRLQRLPARDRGGALRASRGARGGGGRRARRALRRGGRRGGGAQAGRAGQPRTSCAPTSRSRSPATSTRGGSGSSTSCPRARPARSSSARSRSPSRWRPAAPPEVRDRPRRLGARLPGPDRMAQCAACQPRHSLAQRSSSGFLRSRWEIGSLGARPTCATPPECRGAWCSRSPRAARRTAAGSPGRRPSSRCPSGGCRRRAGGRPSRR